MIEFIFNYEEQEIKYTVDLLGREKVFVDDKLVAKPTNILSSVTEVEITINNQRLKLSRMVRSYADGEYQVTLSNEEKIIDKQSKFVIDISMSGEETMYRGDEVDWLSEVKVPQGVIYCAWALYMGIIVHSFAGEFTQIGNILDVSAWAIVGFETVSVCLFFYWAVKAIASSPGEEETM